MTYRFGVFEFDDRAAVLKRSDRPVALEPQPARALALLLSRAGELVSREELRAHLWGMDTHVDFDRGLAYCLGQLRAALGDTADNPRFVQTLPRRGFRFIAPVDEMHTADASVQAAESTVAASSVAPLARLKASRYRWAVASVALVALVIAVAGAWSLSRERSSTRPIVAVAVFDNESGDTSYERAVAGLSDVIVERLTALGPERIGVNGNASVLRRPRAYRDLKAVAEDTRASFLVSGQLQTKDGRLSLLMQLIRLDDGTHVWVQRISRPTNDTLDALDQEAARRIEAAVRQFVLKDVARTS
jgi:DNA-binding winged helix-turn-helix (wHTH) protein/TolB-like protein